MSWQHGASPCCWSASSIPLYREEPAIMCNKTAVSMCWHFYEVTFWASSTFYSNGPVHRVAECGGITLGNGSGDGPAADVGSVASVLLGSRCWCSLSPRGWTGFAGLWRWTHKLAWQRLKPIACFSSSVHLTATSLQSLWFTYSSRLSNPFCLNDISHFYTDSKQLTK